MIRWRVRGIPIVPAAAIAVLIAIAATLIRIAVRRHQRTFDVPVRPKRKLELRVGVRYRQKGSLSKVPGNLGSGRSSPGLVDTPTPDA
jgi:hypothetical protein